MNGRFRRNTILANTALVLLGNIGGVFVNPSPRRKLFGSQTDDNCIPKLVLSLSLSESHKCITAKKKLDEVFRNINSLS